MDSEKFRYLQEQKAGLLNGLRNKGITDNNVLNAFAKVPREKFISNEFIDRAYEDSALPISAKQTISQPFTVAYMTQLLRISPGDKVLEIGTGSGYQAAILNAAGPEVYSIERIEELHNSANEMFDKLGINIHTKHGDGTLGWPEHAPYDGIIITAAAPKLPENLYGQLKIGGRIVAPVGTLESQIMYVIIRIDENGFEIRKKDRFKFVPLIGKAGWDGNSG
ncbi:MAG: protein-L-isoaspartate(D-aspartate) O-methyltransferase [Bacteroidota bacterium]